MGQGGGSEAVVGVFLGPFKYVLG
uniref:Uncharacterized protein n=1 Tax=Arundo donax TaxID=35708 RepID=A0A0A9F4P3_ARUDO